MIKHIIKGFLCALLAVCLCACGANNATAPTPAPQEAEQAATITDASGAVLELPENGGETTIASVYAVSVPFIVALRLDEQVVAINYKSRFWGDTVSALGAAGSVGRGAVDLEALATYEPGVLIHRANDPQTVEAVQKLDIDVLCIYAESMDTITDTLKLMGAYFGTEERADEIVGWIEKKFDKIDGIVAEIPEGERVSAVLMGGELGKVAGGDMLQSWMIEKAGGISASSDVENNSNWASVGVETVFEWDPDYLLCTSSAVLDYTPEQLMEDPAWSEMTAVRQGNVALVPAKMDSWDLPGIASVIGTFWMLREMYPDYFSADELQQEIDEYYTLMFGQQFDPEYLGYSLE